MAPKVGPMAPKVGPIGSHQRGRPQGYIRKGRGGGAPPLETFAAPSSLLRFLVHLAIVRSRGSSNPECEASSRTCGLRKGAALAAQE